MWPIDPINVMGAVRFPVNTLPSNKSLSATGHTMPQMSLIIL